MAQPMSMHESERTEPASTPQRAGMRPRLLAFALDYLVIAACALGLAAVTLLAANPLRGLLTALLATPASRDAVAFVTVVLPVSLYFALQEGSARQGTWGKRKLGLRVTGWPARRCWSRFSQQIPHTTNHRRVDHRRPSLAAENRHEGGTP